MINQKILKLIRTKKAQSLSEYAILLGVAIAAIAAMQFFIKRRAQAIIYDTISGFGNPNFTEQVNPVVPGSLFVSESTTTTSANIVQKGGGSEAVQTVIGERVSRRGTVNREETTQ